MTNRAARACAECGASWRFGECAQLFAALLALDHQRLQPWGRFHGLDVACYLLQHPSQAPHRGGHAEHLELVSAFVDGGLAAATALEHNRVRLNRHRRLSAPRRPLPPRTGPSGFTILDVSVDGTFPADGYEQRMERWASAVHREHNPS